MRRFRRLRPTPAMMVACIALLVALAGTSVAAVTVVLPRNSVGPLQLRANSVSTFKVQNRSLRSIDFALGQIPTGPRGASGPAGVPGPVGPTGPAGATGATVASSIDDVVALANTGIALLRIGNKEYGPWPIWRLPASTFLKAFIGEAGAEAANQFNAYGQLDGPLYSLFPNLMLSPLQAFALELQWPSGAVDTTANVVVEVLFDGQLARSVQ